MQRKDSLVRFCKLLNLNSHNAEEKILDELEGICAEFFAKESCIVLPLQKISEALSMLEEGEIAQELDGGLADRWTDVESLLNEVAKEMEKREMEKEKEVKSMFPDHLPKVGDVVRITIPEIPYYNQYERVVETTVICRERYRACDTVVFFECVAVKVIENITYRSVSGAEKWTAEIKDSKDFHRSCDISVEVIS